MSILFSRFSVYRDLDIISLGLIFVFRCYFTCFFFLNKILIVSKTEMLLILSSVVHLIYHFSTNLIGFYSLIKHLQLFTSKYSRFSERKKYIQCLIGQLVEFRDIW